MFATAFKSISYGPCFLRGGLLCINKSQNQADAAPWMKQQVRTTGKGIGDPLIRSMIRGIDFLRNPSINRTLGFSLFERQSLGINGFLASSVKSQREQLDICRASIRRFKNPLNKYLYLTELYDTNERLFYSLIGSNVEAYMPLVYTPVVGLACQKFGFAYRRPKGLFISIHDQGHIQSIIDSWPEPDVRAICFTDGERILGLGDLGAYGMGIPIGKLALYTALAGVKPYQCLPVTLDFGTNNKNLLADPLYIGIRQRRVTGKQFYELIDEFLRACVVRYGETVLLQFEDFALHTATDLLHKYQDKYCTFNDDIQGTASVAVAGLLSATRITKKKMRDHVYFFLGAGSASCGIATLAIEAMKEEGMSVKDAKERMYFFDIDGLLTTKRKGGVPPHAKPFERALEPSKNFEACIDKYKPTTLIGCSTVGGAFTTSILKKMASFAARPIIFALSNPTIKAECTPQQAYKHTKGKCIYASGSPFAAFKFNGKKVETGQGNNSYIFPGVALGVIVAGSIRIPEVLFLQAAKTLARIVNEHDLELGRIYPPINDIQKASIEIAIDVAELTYKMHLATNKPKPKDMREFVISQLYSFAYPQLLPDLYRYPPDPPEIQVKSIDEIYPKGPIRRGC